MQQRNYTTTQGAKWWGKWHRTISSSQPSLWKYPPILRKLHQSHVSTYQWTLSGLGLVCSASSSQLFMTTESSLDCYTTIQEATQFFKTRQFY
ncbi:hypothetical protein H671_2g5911 [Cricetulus griseus]|uniref:Uncharacterized protein n=2 Tax=Cricetulus griseus TaxID=10029 RepID=A0A061II61_CRIGR|nr:hypothetical protein H671_2g5911 [Cricetulus griseus]